jgi:hypothetical protein
LLSVPVSAAASDLARHGGESCDQRTSPGRWLSLGAGVIGAAWIAAAGVLYRPDGSALPLACPFHTVTGLDCPGCGSTRALGALARLDPIAALDHNLLVPLAFVFIAASWVLWVRATWTGRAAPALIRGPAAIAAIGVLFVAFTVVRNLGAASWLGSGLASG